MSDGATKKELSPVQLEELLKILKSGGALFADRRYGNVFVYHNSAPSYYSSRAFRGSLRV